METPPSNPPAALPEAGGSVAATPPTDAAGVWASVQQLAEKQAPLSWVAHLRLLKLEAQTAWVASVPGQRDLSKFASTPLGREKLASLFKQVMGRAVRIEIQTASMEETPQAGMPLGAGAAGNSAAAPPGAMGMAGGRAGAGTTTDRAAAMALPLVRQVMDVLEASIIDVRSIAEAEAEARKAAEVPVPEKSEEVNAPLDTLPLPTQEESPFHEEDESDV